MINLPKPPRGKSNLRYISNSTQVKAAYGGPTKLINRLGDRYECETAVKGRGTQAAPLIAKLNQARRDKARMPIEQAVQYDRFTAPVTVATAVSGGMTVRLSGTGQLTAGQFINLTGTNDRRYLHMVTADVTLVAGGTQVEVIPPIRSNISFGSHVEVNDPTIEGYLSSTTNEWAINFHRIIEVSFTITEAE